jgi:purine-binding chemotaxis protein CheW
MHEEPFQIDRTAAKDNTAAPKLDASPLSRALASSRFGFAIPEPAPYVRKITSEALSSEARESEAQETDASDDPSVQMPQEDPMRQYCIFRAGRERFCFSILDVEEIVEWPQLTVIPLAPPFLMGIFNLRGSIVPVVDIAITEGRRVDLAPRHVVVAGLKADEGRDYLRIGIAADELIGTYSTVDPLMVDSAPLEVPHCCGLLPHDDRLALVLDLKKVTEAFPVPVI